MEDAYAGIDVAFAKKKPLPVCVCVRRGGRLVPLPVRAEANAQPPRGEGNRVAALELLRVEAFARATAAYLQGIEERFDLRIRCIALDAPSAPCRKERTRRASERALDERGIRCFATPSKEQFALICRKVRKHINAGGAESRVSHAMQLWMLAGFALFRELRKHFACFEVFPQATVRALGLDGGHKSGKAGYAQQLAAAAKHTGWQSVALEHELARASGGAKHDRLDAYLCAWVASLPEREREALGEPENDDVIWCRAQASAKLSKPQASGKTGGTT